MEVDSPATECCRHLLHLLRRLPQFPTRCNRIITAGTLLTADVVDTTCRPILLSWNRRRRRSRLQPGSITTTRPSCCSNSSSSLQSFRQGNSSSRITITIIIFTRWHHHQPMSSWCTGRRSSATTNLSDYSGISHTMNWIEYRSSIYSFCTFDSLSLCNLEREKKNRNV